MNNKLIWPTGIGGAQCEQCGDTTVVRNFPAMSEDFHTEVDGELLCRVCVEGNKHVHAYFDTPIGRLCVTCRERTAD